MEFVLIFSKPLIYFKSPTGWHNGCETDKKWVSSLISDIIGQPFLSKMLVHMLVKKNKNNYSTYTLLFWTMALICAERIHQLRTPDLDLHCMALNFLIKYLRYNQQLTKQKNAQKFRFWSYFYQIKIFVSNALCHPVLILPALNSQTM